MELKPGYKQTEVGWIPVEWDVVKIGTISKITTGPFGTLLKASEYSVDDNGAPLVSVGEVRDGFIRITRHTPRVPLSVIQRLPQYILRSGDIVFGRKGAVDRSALITENEDGYFLGSDGISVRLSGPCNPAYVSCQLRSHRIRDWLVQNATGTTMASLNQEILKKIPLALPPRPQQDSIASALSDLDDFIQGLDELIFKKRNIKQAAMQELLTGKRRLPGFEGEWEVKSLGSEISDLEAGVSVVSLQGKDQASTGSFVLKTSAVTSGQLIASESKEIAPTDLARAKTPIRKGDVIISRMNTPALVGECGYSESDYPNLYLPDRLWRVSCQNPAAVSSRWLAYSLSFDHNRARIKELATGTSGSMKNISKHALLSLRIQWPTLAEQQAVAGYISLLDEEVKALATKLQKTRALKQAMMQELLTGRIRLR